MCHNSHKTETENHETMRKVGQYTILAYRYYCVNPPFFAVAAVEKMEGTWTGRINIITGVDEETDLLITAADGAKLDRDQALAFFPKLDADKCLN